MTQTVTSIRAPVQADRPTRTSSRTGIARGVSTSRASSALGIRTLLMDFLNTAGSRRCTCTNTEEPWCLGMDYVFLTPSRAHHRRSNYSSRYMRPAMDGWFPKNEGERRPKPAKPVLVDFTDGWPGRPVLARRRARQAVRAASTATSAPPCGPA
ncbi:hypothetical protein LO762_26675 [Actinocorallia sp. API 0066]|uniref:hypothetical protein n=1 Tax=Actinocorallia sp. API 0066 TaxID=2896846 RepID=UPI001E560ED2|nr:hypothetical protein [Actinocorallia sp. API 0066]MCD0452740.1 hypothetical protein [Actinocorallia sp. API 0066]